MPLFLEWQVRDKLGITMNYEIPGVGFRRATNLMWGELKKFLSAK